MIRQRARHQRKAVVRRKEPGRCRKTSKSSHRRMPLEGIAQKPDASVVPNIIEFLEIDVVGPFDADLEAEEFDVVDAEGEDEV